MNSQSAFLGESPLANPGSKAFTPEEASRLFFQHLVDNVGQFQQLYDGLFRWKMNDAPLPPFKLVRNHFRDLLLASGAHTGPPPIAAVAMQKQESDEEMDLDRSISSVGESILNQLLESSEEPILQGTESPYETASESVNVSREHIDTSDVYERLYGHLVNKSNAAVPIPLVTKKHRQQAKKDTFWEPDNLRSFYESVTPPSSLYENKDAWLDEPLTTESNLDEDFDFEKGLAEFEKIPLEGEAAQAASANAKKQEKVIRRLFKRARAQPK